MVKGPAKPGVLNIPCLDLIVSDPRMMPVGVWQWPRTSWRLHA